MVGVLHVSKLCLLQPPWQLLYFSRESPIVPCSWLPSRAGFVRLLSVWGSLPVLADSVGAAGPGAPRSVSRGCLSSFSNLV